MRKFITMIRTGKAWEKAAGPEKTYEQHKTLFRAATSPISEIEIWSSSKGIVKRRKVDKELLAAAAKATAAKAATKTPPAKKDDKPKSKSNE